MDEAMGELFGSGIENGHPSGWPTFPTAERLTVEIGSLIAALSALTEDETELDLRLQALIESNLVELTLGEFVPGDSACLPAPLPVEIDAIRRS